MNPTFDLPEEFNVYHAQQTLESLRLWLAEHQFPQAAVLDISAARVTDMDGTGLQLLGALRNAGYRLRLLAPSQKFAHACMVTGNQAWLEAEAVV